LIAALYFNRGGSRSGADLADERSALFEIFVVIERQVFVTSLGRGNSVRVFEVFKWIESLNGKRLCADAGDLLVNVTIKSRYQRHHDHEGGDPDNHTKQRQGRAQFMRPDRC
jgi:hypothetical protein